MVSRAAGRAAAEYRAPAFPQNGNTLGEYGFLACLLAIGLGFGDAESRKSAPGGTS